MEQVIEEQLMITELRHDRSAQRAFELFLARGAGHGQDLEDWLRAEHEVRAEAR